jgi:hypothetical protein
MNDNQKITGDPETPGVDSATNIVGDPETPGNQDAEAYGEAAAGDPETPGITKPKVGDPETPGNP